MSFQSTSFDMGSVLNKLRSIAENDGDQLNELDPGMEVGGQEIDNSSFTRTMSRLTAIKDAVSEENFNALKAGVRSLYMNRRPNIQQMTALMDLLETILSYIAEDNALYQRLKSDLAKEEPQPETTPDPEVGSPETAEPTSEPEMRGLKS